METEFLFYQDRFRKPDALVIPEDIVGRYHSRGCVLIRPSQCGEECEKDLKKKRSDFEKIDMEKVLLINARYFDFFHEQSCKHFYEKNHTDSKHTYASDKYGYLMIEEFEENYLIEIREVKFKKDKIKFSKDMVKEFKTLGYEAKIIGDNILVYVKKKIRI
jgi:hypothetical protein